MADVSIFAGIMESRLFPKSDGCPACMERICAVIAGCKFRSVAEVRVELEKLSRQIPCGGGQPGGWGCRVVTTALRDRGEGRGKGLGGRRAF